MDNITCKYASEVLYFYATTLRIAGGQSRLEVLKAEQAAKVLEAFGDQVLPPTIADMYDWESMVKRYKKYLAA